MSEGITIETSSSRTTDRQPAMQGDEAITEVGSWSNFDICSLLSTLVCKFVCCFLVCYLEDVMYINIGIKLFC